MERRGREEIQNELTERENAIKEADTGESEKHTMRVAYARS
jgi:hypothetical protein